MSTPTHSPDTTQVDFIQTASAIATIITDRAMLALLQGEGQLKAEQIATIAHRFEDGISRFKQEVRQHRMPNAVEISRIAIVADHLSHKYPQGLAHDHPDEVRVDVADLREALQLLSGDVSRLSESRAEWEGIVRATFAMAATTAPHPLAKEQQIHTARNIGMVIARSIGVDTIFSNAFAAGEVPLAEVPPLPQYPPTDPRSENPALMGKLQLTLSVTEGILETLTPVKPGENHETHMVEWFRDRATRVVNRAVDKARDLVVPAAISKLGSQLGNKERILRESRDLLKTVLYEGEPQVATAAADHAVERSIGTILFLSICPNIPFIIPTLELRLAFTKPFSYITRAMHEAMGRIFVVGFFFLLLRGLGQLLDGIPRAQVRFVQNVVTESWLANPTKRAQLIRRYLRYVDRRADRPQIDALTRVFLSLVQ